MDPDSTSLILLIVLIFVSALFSSSETALFSLSRAKVQTLIASDVRGARLIEYLKNRPQKMLVIILLGNNLANVAASAIATVYFTRLFNSYGIGITTGIMTLAILIFGEVFPKSLATRFPVKVSQVVIYPLITIEYALYPIIWLFEKALSKIVGNHIHHISEDEVKAMVSMGAREGSLEKHEQEFIENVLEFNDINVGSIMTPRTEIAAISDSATIEEAIKFTNKFHHSRIPVYHDSMDNLTGFITVKKLLEFSTARLKTKLRDIELYQFIKVPETRTVYSLFLELKRSRTHIALVLDEHGGVEGIVTMEDILEEIVGDINDESDESEDRLRVVDKYNLFADGDVEIEDIEKALDIEIPSYDNKDTVSRAILDFLKRFPRRGESVVIDHVKLTVKDMDSNTKKIKKVKVALLKD